MLCIFYWLILDIFVKCCFQLVLLGEALVGFSERTHNRELPSNSTTHATSPSLDEDWPLVWLVVHFACPTISSIPHYCTVSTSHHNHHLVLKTEQFCFSRDNMWKYCQAVFLFFCFCLTYVEPKHQSDDITKLVQIIFNAWFE